MASGPGTHLQYYEVTILVEEVWRLEQFVPAGLGRVDVLYQGKGGLELLLHHPQGRVGHVVGRVHLGNKVVFKNLDVESSMFRPVGKPG